MPAKKRTDQSKRTPSASPTTSTSHASTDQHHRLRHTGPSITTRSSVNTVSSKPPVRAHPEPTQDSPPTLEASDEKKLFAEVSPPNAPSSFTRFLYVVVVLALLLFGWYVYGMITLLERLKEEVGWWGVITGDYSGGTVRWEASEGSEIRLDRPGRQGQWTVVEKGGELEGSLNALADALGISPMQVASAVRPLIPQASLTSIASKADETGSSEAVRILFEDTMRDRADTARIMEEFAERSERDAAKEIVAEGDKV